MSNDLLIDKRIIERNIKKGRVEASEHRRMLEGLPDLKGQVWQRPEVRFQEAAPAPVQTPASVAPPPPPAASSYDSSDSSESVDEADEEEPESPEPSSDQPSPFG
jgi:hypothetical protein